MNHSEIVTLLISETEAASLMALYEHERIENPPAYVRFAAKHDGVTVLLYEKPHDGRYKAVFQGYGAGEEAKPWGVPLTPKKKPTSRSSANLGAHLGSDEVGTGDFFGPVVVVATYMGAKQMPLVKRYSIGDSKTMTDAFIREVGPELIKQIPYSLLIVPNEKYNQLVVQGFNLNRIKAWLHQTALVNLKKRLKTHVPIIIDQFCSPKMFAKHVIDHPEKLTNVIFETKAESRYPAVGAASMIARYAFLDYMDRLNQEYDVKFPFGASRLVDDFAKRFIEKKGREAFERVTKHNFRNYRDLSKTNLD
ncbi:MAG: ribonuclease HIII [Bacilli bacterium]|jgi:ribonuclease HIII